MTDAIVLKDIRKVFGRLEVLHGVTLRAAKGEVVSILGASGSGKSTLLRCANRLETPDAGEVRLGDLVVPAVKADRRTVDLLRQRTAMVFQAFNLWSHRTILENVMEAPVHVQRRPRAEVREEARALLDRVGILDKADSYPAQLSGGQQQRAAIARALATRPEVMLFDEPTSALDPELVGEVLRVMRDLAAEGRTMLVVTHEMGFARDVSNRVVYLHQGQVEEQGPPDQLFTRPESARLRQFLGLAEQ